MFFKLPVILGYEPIPLLKQVNYLVWDCFAKLRKARNDDCTYDRSEQRLTEITKADIDARLDEFVQLVNFDIDLV